jgi:hypothetical protein
MLLSTYKISQMLHLTLQGTRLLLQRLQVPLLLIKNKLFFDSSQTTPFSLSLRLHYRNPSLQVMYSISQLSSLHRKDPKTIRKILSHNQIPVYGQRKKFVLLWDLRHFQQQIGKI